MLYVKMVEEISKGGAGKSEVLLSKGSLHWRKVEKMACTSRVGMDGKLKERG
jgi:hypothetical protein